MIKMTWLVTLLGFGIGGHAGARSLEAIGVNNSGLKALKDEENFRAYRSFAEAVNLDPERLEYRLNLAYALSANEEWDKAEAEYRLVDQFAESQPEIRFAARFNLGRILSEKGDIDGALAAYQSALDLKPSSKEVKTNIELLWQQQQKNSKSGRGQKNQNQDGQGEGEEHKPDEGSNPLDPKPDQGKKEQPQSFENLTPEMVRKVLEELKSQEQRVRADHLNQAPKEKPRDKQW